MSNKSTSTNSDNNEFINNYFINNPNQSYTDSDSIPIIQAQVVIPENNNNNNLNPPIRIAPSFTTINPNIHHSSPTTSQQNQTSLQTKYASDIGRIQAKQEISTIQKVSANAKQYHSFIEKKRVEVADEIANWRDREGFDLKVKEQESDVNEKVGMEKMLCYGDDGDHKNNNNDDDDDTSSSRENKGYQVAEYDTKDYECGDYNVTEYKSIYD